MKKRTQQAYFALLLAIALVVLPGCAQKEQKTDIPVRFAAQSEGQELLLGNEAYLEGLNQNDLSFRLQKKDGTLEEYKTFAAQQVQDFSEDEKSLISGEIDNIEAICQEQGYHLPELDEVVFVKTTMAEECYAAAYTHGTTVYLGAELLEYVRSGSEGVQSWFSDIIAHELFHCYTRNDTDFRTDMYALLGFTVQQEDYVFGDAVAERMISNPDVEHHNSCATFRINGQDIPCTVVFTTEKPFEKEGDSFFDAMVTGLVPVDDLNTMYTSEEAENFWDVFGRNTDYVIDPEETLADNFSFAILNRDEERELQTPEQVEKIRAYLKG